MAALQLCIQLTSKNRQGQQRLQLCSLQASRLHAVSSERRVQPTRKATRCTAFRDIANDKATERTILLDLK